MNIAIQKTGKAVRTTPPHVQICIQKMKPGPPAIHARSSGINRVALIIQAIRYEKGNHDSNMDKVHSNVHRNRIGGSYSFVYSEFGHGMNKENAIQKIQRIDMTPTASEPVVSLAISVRLPSGTVKFYSAAISSSVLL